MPKSSKSTSSWKALVKAHIKGPKRVKMPGTRRPRDHTPLTDMSQSKTVQLVLEEESSNKNVVVLLYKERFVQLRLKEGKTYSMFPNSLTRAAKILKPALDKMTHNDVVIKEVKEMKLAGKCMVFVGKARFPHATIHILRKQTEEEIALRKHVEELFNGHVERAKVCKHETEKL
jgi:hypothetical protein